MQDNNLTQKEFLALKAIRNHFLHKSQPPSVRDLTKDLNYSSTRSAHLLINRLTEKGYLQKKNGFIQLLKNFEFEYQTNAQTVEVPLLGRATCGSPMMVEEHPEAYIPVSTTLAKPPHKYFLLQASGDSMDKKSINDGDLVLVRKQNTANNGESIVALIDSETTIKEFYFNGSTIVLKPRSTNPVHQPIILTSDFQVQGVVVTVIPNIWQQKERN